MGASGEKASKSVSKNDSKNEIKQELTNESKERPKSEKTDEIIIGSKPIPVKIVIKVMKAICKIRIDTKEGIAHGTGFFMNYSDSLKCLMTNYHVINPNVENENIEIEIHNKKIMKLKFKGRYTKYIEKPKDMALIEIKESDEIYNDIIFLDYDNIIILKEDIQFIKM